MTRPYRLICACCGGQAIGRQWWNRDTGYGLCNDCVDFVAAREDISQLYGKRGFHFDVPESEHPKNWATSEPSQSGATLAKDYPSY